MFSRLPAFFNTFSAVEQRACLFRRPMGAMRARRQVASDLLPKITYASDCQLWLYFFERRQEQGLLLCVSLILDGAAAVPALRLPG